MRLSAVVNPTDTTITLVWEAFTGTTGFTVYRRPAGATTWGPASVNLPGTAAQWTDEDVEMATAYEYKVVRTGNGTGYGYVRSGITVPEVDYRGKVVLLVEAGIAAQVALQLEQLEDDLNGDGWLVLRHDVQATDAPQSVRALVAADHAADPAYVKLVYIIGHVPVPYSGNTNPDGHTEHKGAWACDAYYGELDGIWTDNTVNAVGGFPWNINVPGDGKFDQNDIPGALELAVGRVDLSALPSFGASEGALLSAYLARAHGYKTKAYTVPMTAVVHDDLQWVSNPLACTGYMSAGPCVGPGNITDLLPSMAPFIDHYSTNDHLFTYHCGAGLQAVDGQGNTQFIGTTNGITTQQLAFNTRGGIFDLSFGSYFGDWDNTDNMLRAMIASGNGLAHVWSGIPNWFLHPMAMGEPIGYCALRSINNGNTDYSLQNGGWQGQSMAQAHMALMGDPTLRMQYIAPPSGLIATNTNWYASFSWSPSTDPVDGYLIYAIDDTAGTLVRVTPTIVTDTFHVSNLQFLQGRKYMVRAMKLVTTPSGSFRDMSLGAIASASGVPVPDCFGVIGGSSIPGAACDDGNAGTGNDVLDAQCVCAGLPLDCEGTPGGMAVPGTPCDDGSSNTGNDLYDAACVCAGQLIDCAGVPGGADLPGSTCDDGNAMTINDAYDANCICVGIVDGIEDATGHTFSIAPNPANDLLRITTDQDLDGRFRVISASGQEMLNTSAKGRRMQLDVSALPSGSYSLLYVPSERSSSTSKVPFAVVRR
ncbi:MAG: hypothetical protein IPJ76_04505 [Flavobacteriales bacterium]|nr:MAG: hypothetical protein IPJ76_04505 [Flavobacteriales bacterium]